ncbi:MAG: hypothetical protein KAV00_16305 [Phycisphaerae bacterium]|nr:hypothetical protein [Phycisphaerae bacterium]
MRKKLLKISVWGMVILFTSVAGAKTKTTFETPTTDADFKKIVGELKTQAKTFAEAADDKAPSQSKITAKIRYSPKSSAPLIKTLKALSGKPPAKLYITYQLISPMTKASDETIRPLVPMLIDMLGKDCVYKSMPRWPRATLDKLKPPKKKDSAEQKKRRNEARRKKTDDEQSVVKHNRTVNALEKTVKQLLVLINDPKADETLLRKITREHKKRLATFKETLLVIKSEAGRMKPDRAKKFYDRLKIMAFKDNKQKQYSDPTKPVYKAQKNSSFAAERANFAVSAIEVINVLATSAKQPAVKLPGTKPPKKRPRKRP